MKNEVMYDGLGLEKISAAPAPAPLPPDYYALRRPEMEKFLPAEMRTLLDVGCGGGDFGKLVKDARNAEVWGIEPNGEACGRAAKILDRAIQGTVESAIAQIPPAYFNCVTFNDVLEHTVEPWAVLRAVRPMLSEGGYVVASIPNIRHYPALKRILFEADFRYDAAGIFDRTHLRFFTKTSIQRLFVESGYSVVSLQGINEFRPIRLRSRTVYWLLKKLFPGLRDTPFMQFVCVATPQA